QEYGCDLYPSAAHPTERMYNASHVHVGTIHDESVGIALERAAIRYAPVFGALAANSPISQHQPVEYKSLRIRHNANFNIRPAAPRDPNVSQPEFGVDTLPKLYGAPTFEVRITDCASSRRFLAELATFVAAYMHYLGTQPIPENVTASEYRQYLTNRWTASRYGMQATFQWDSGHRPVADLIEEMLDQCSEELSTLGARRSDLVLINQMLRKRICQADFVIDLAERYPEPYSLASVHAKLVRHWTVFDEYLEKAPVLDPAPAIDHDQVLAIHAEVIGEGTHFYNSRDPMKYPPPAADALIQELVESGRVRREVVPNRGILLSRIA
ncbi:MAG TPA: glutamate-cysteine ligase family protein, partial [Capsulimonadaceae bacterium]|nr:glutamate-cysteine ligase family protein [Capsulimonadaceae bacterium]